MRFVAVLVDPARPANVGAAARALKNFGGELRLVRGEHALPGGPGHAEARALAWNAGDVLDSARSFATLEEAIADASWSAGTSSRAAGPGEELLDPRAFAAEAARLPRGGAGERAVIACVFGSEESGLSNEELALCRARLRIPARSEQPSLNLAQAVVIVAYEVACAVEAEASAAGAPSGDRAEGAAEPAREEDLSRLAGAFQDLATRAGYLNPQAPGHVLAELRRMLARARPTAREVTLLQGLVAQLRWAQDHLPRRE